MAKQQLLPDSFRNLCGGEFAGQSSDNQGLGCCKQTETGERQEWQGGWLARQDTQAKDSGKLYKQPEQFSE